MKKLLALLLSLVMVLSLAACGEGGDKTTGDGKTVKVGLICIGDENDQGYTYNFIRGKEAATEALKAKGIRCSVDERNEKLGYRVREAQIAKIPAQIVVGEGECEERTVTIRRSGQKQSVTLPLQEAIDAFVQEIEEKRA